MKSKKPNLIDVLIILVLVLVTSAAVYRTLSIKQLPDTVKNKEIEYTLLISGVDSLYANAVKTGDTVYLTEKSLACGEVSAVQTAYVRKEITAADGTFSLHLYPAEIDMTLTLRLSADISENGFYIGDNTYLNLGKNMKMHTETFTFDGKLVDFHPIAAQE